MFVLKTFIEAFASMLHTVISIYIWVVIIQSVISWVRPDPFSPIVQILNKLTLPVYRLLRGRVPTVFGGVDLAPLIIIIALQFLDLFLVKLLYQFAVTV
jgi:YggT family protein